MDHDVAAAPRRAETRRRVQRAPRHARRGRHRPGHDGPDGHPLHPQRAETSAIAIDKELTKMVLVPHGIRMPAGKMVESESLFDADPMPRPYVVKPVNEGSSVGVAIVTDDGNYGNPIGRDVDGPVARVRRAAGRAVHQGPRADRRGAGRRGAGGDRAEAQRGLLRLCRQIYRRADRPCLPGRNPRRHCPGDDGHGRARRTGCSAARARRARISAGTTSRARPASICSRSTPSRA